MRVQRCPCDDADWRVARVPRPGTGNRGPGCGDAPARRSSSVGKLPFSLEESVWALLVGGVAYGAQRFLGLIFWNRKKRIPEESPREEAMANLGFAKKDKKAAIQRKIFQMDRHIEARAGKAPPPRKRGTRLDPKERSWANAYLKHVAQAKGLPYQSVRESMQVIGSYFGIEIPASKEGAGRSAVAISLAKAIYAKTGILLPSQQ
jgi:hypothetical protein